MSLSLAPSLAQLAQLTQPCYPALAQVFIYMNHLPKVDSWGAHMAFVKFGERVVYSQSCFWCHAKKIITYLSNNLDELELNMRDDPYNHGTGELAYRVKEIVDTFPLYIKSRNIDCQNTKYNGFVLKFQLMCTFSGRITRLSRPYCGRVADATIFNLEHDGAQHIVLGDKAYIGCFQCLTAAKGAQPENVRLRIRHMNYYRQVTAATPPPLPLALLPAPFPARAHTISLPHNAPRAHSVRIEHTVRRVKMHGLFHRPKDWSRLGFAFAGALVNIVTHATSVEIKDIGGVYDTFHNGPWAH